MIALLLIETTTNLSIRATADSIVVHPAIEAEGYRPVTGTTFTVSDQEAAIDAATEEILGRIARDGTMVPGVLLEAVEGGDVGHGHPARFAVLELLRLAPLSALVVAKDPDMVTCKDKSFIHQQCYSWRVVQVKSVEQWSRNPVTWVRNQGDALVPFGKALILTDQVPRRGLKAVCRLVAFLQAIMLS